ncbi:hypothetical protein Gpo141_00009551, partial [Globisporangium polare]
MANRVLAPLQRAMSASPVSLRTAMAGLFMTRTALQFLGSLYAFFLRPSKSLKKFGQWA